LAFFGFFLFFFFLSFLSYNTLSDFRHCVVINSIFFGFFFPNFLSLHLCLDYLFSRLCANCGSCVREREREREREGGGKSRQLTGVEERGKRSMNNTYIAERKCSCVCFLTGELLSFFCSSRSL
jgi:hypothetical protein